MAGLIKKLSNTIQFHYYKNKNEWVFPPNMAHTSGARMANGSYEPDLTRCISERLSEGDTVLDVGANVGYYTRLCAETVSRSGRVYAFEAESENYRCLCSNVAGFEQVTPLALAVSSKEGITTFHKSSHSSCHSMLETGNYQEAASINVATIRLDTFWKLYLDRQEVRCVKIDVEGAETLVLEGMKEMLTEKAVGLLIVELCPQIIINAGFDPIDLYDRLNPNFSIRVVESEFKSAVGDREIRSREQFLKFNRYLLDQGGFRNCNLLCEHRKDA
jgi:FkbM family methyltransferase